MLAKIIRLRVNIIILREAFTTISSHFKSTEITLVGSYQGNYFENATACSKRTLKTTVATQLKGALQSQEFEKHY
jgi:hypothetical protein